MPVDPDAGVALVTGANKGIGEAVAAGLARPRVHGRGGSARRGAGTGRDSAAA